MQTNEQKKQYVAPKLAELGNVSTLTQLVQGGGGGSCSHKFLPVP